eukprot:m.104755 g.104755  ORF g.104755 m.104755 type:complete len:129 (+) comp27592_c0_seq3:386-772(+)
MADLGSTVEVSGKLIHRKKGFFSTSSRPCFAYLSGTQMLVSSTEITSKQGLKSALQQKTTDVLEISGCVLMGIEMPLGFSIQPVGKKATTFEVQSEDEQTKWMSSLLEAKLTRASGNSTSDGTLCCVQ